ncbi:MAG: hypothetical protein P3X22_000095 [Thermoprotei archaeon]|nr:hypothetical protein [Thermoprotei archaeon]
MVSARLLGLALTIIGTLGGVVYAYLILYTSLETSILILRFTAAAIALLIGALIAGVGIALILGWREFEESKARRKEGLER